MDPPAAHMGSGSAQPQQPFVISKALVVGIVEYANWGRLEGAGADAALSKQLLDDLGVGKVATVLQGKVMQAELHEALEQWVRDIPHAARHHERPVLIGFFSCHGMMKANNFPLLLASDAPRGAEVSEVFDVEEQLLARINRIQLDKGRRLRVILVFDCCLSPMHGMKHDTWKVRGRSSGPSCHDFYFLFACDPGLETLEHPRGGALMQELLPRLRQPKPIDQIFNEVSAAVAQKSEKSTRLMSQRPWAVYRLSEQGLVLAECEPAVPIVVALVGETGAGKSTLGNALLGEPKFKVSRGLKSETSGVQQAETEFGGCALRVLDVQGFGDNREGQEVFDAGMLPSDIDAFLFVHSCGRFTAPHLTMLDQLRRATRAPPERILLVFSKASSQAELSQEQFTSYVLEESQQCPVLRDALARVDAVIATECDSDQGRDRARRVLCDRIQALAAGNMRGKLHIPHSSGSYGLQESPPSQAATMPPASTLSGPADRGPGRPTLAGARSRQKRPAPEQRSQRSDGPDIGKVFQAFRAVGDAFAETPDVRDNVGARMFVDTWRSGVGFMADRHWQKQVKDMTDMGFAAIDARRALEATAGDVQEAVNILLTQES